MSRFMNKQKRITVHVAFATVVIFSIIFSPAWIFGTEAIFKHNYSGGFGCLIGGLFFFLWICSATVYFEDGKLTYSMFFFIRRSVDLETVTKVKTVANPAPTLVLQQRHSKPFKFVIKPFSKAAVAVIMHHIKLHAPNAEVDRISADLEEGDFASVTREALRVQNLFQLFGLVIGTMFVVAFAQAEVHSTMLTIGIIVLAVLILLTVAALQRRK